MTDEPEGRSRKLSRQIKRHLKQDDAENIIVRLGVLHDDASILGGMPDLFANIDKTYGEYEDKIKFTIRSLEVSSEEQNALNHRLENLNASINAMLDGLGQGLVFFDETGVCSPIFSKACLTLLETDPGGRHLADILKLDARGREDLQSWLEVVFDTAGAMSFADLKPLAPDHFINSRKQYIELDYRPIELVGEIKAGILLIATDRTLEREAAGKLAKTRSEARKIQSIAMRRNDFWRFASNIRAFLDQIREVTFAKFERNELMRGLHTYKGLALLFGLNELAEILHDTEGRVEQGWQHDDNETLLYQHLEMIEHELAQALTLGRDLFGADFFSKGQVRNVEFARFENLKRKLAALPLSTGERDGLLAYVDTELLALPVEECFAAFCSEIWRIAETQGKPAPEISFTGDRHRIVMSDYEAFFDSLIHMARNIVDHGIEGPAQRREKGKSENGHVTVSTAIGDGFYTFAIEDDGKGFSLHHIRERLRQMGEGEELSDEAALQKIFNPSFSTASQSTLTSGRGVGLTAVKAAVEGLGGTVRAMVGEKGGAKFIFTLKIP